MNFTELFAAMGPRPKVALTWRNPGNVVLDRIIALSLDALSGQPGVFITGSQVWKPVYGLEVAVDADIDIIVTGDEVLAQERVRSVVRVLELEDTGILTGPSLEKDREATTVAGAKYSTPAGGTVDIWGMSDIHSALRQYPKESYASAKMAWDCEHGCLLVYPNDLAVS